MRRVRVLTLVFLGLGLLGASGDRDPAYWADRLEQALLPLASMRATFVLESRDRAQPAVEMRARLTRIQGPSSIRSVVSIEEPPRERRVLKVRSKRDGTAERTLYLGAGDPVRIDVDRHDRVLRTAFSYEELGFVELRHLSDAAVELEDRPSGRVVRLTAKPYGPYGKVVAYLDPDSALPKTMEFFDRKGVLRRTVTYSQVDREGPYRFPLHVEALEVDTGRRSAIRFERVEFGPEIYEYEFSDSHLRRVLQDLQARSLG